MILQPEISVILSTYNRNRPQDNCPSLFLRALNSILNQTFANFELILIDDASIDGTPALCQQYAAQDSRIQLILHEKNTQLPAKCYNEGMQKSRGKFITFMFDDDEWLPNALQDLHDFFVVNKQKTPDLGMIYGLAEFYDIKNGCMIDTNFGSDWDLKLIFKHNYLANCCVMVSKEVIDVVGGYDEHPVLRRICDWDLWQRIGRRYPVLRMNSQIARVYHNHKDSLGVIFDWQPSKAQMYRLTRFGFPLKNKIAPFPQQWNYLKSFFTLYIVGNLVELPSLIMRCMKSFLKMIGCFQIVKYIYIKSLNKYSKFD